MYKKNKKELSKLWIFKDNDIPIDRKQVKYAEIRTIREVNIANKSQDEVIEMVRFAINNWGHVTFYEVDQHYIIEVFAHLEEREKPFLIMEEHVEYNGKKKFNGWYSVKIKH